VTCKSLEQEDNGTTTEKTCEGHGSEANWGNPDLFMNQFSLPQCRAFLALAIISLGAWLPLPLLAEGQLDRGLALYLPLTTDLKDHSGAQLPIKVKGTVRAEPEGAAFDGGDDWLEAPHIALDHRPFAIAFWMKDTTSEQSVGLVEQLDQNTARRHFHIVLRKERQPFFSFYSARFISPLSIPTDQEWVHMAFQFTGTEQMIWINGRLICTRKTPPYEGTNGVTTIGKLPRWRNVPGKNFKGHLRDFRIYDRTLDPGEIALLSRPGRGTSAAIVNNAQIGDSPDLSQKAKASRAAMERMLATDVSLPFLEISESELTINGQPGQVYTLQATTDLAGWQSLGQLTNQTGRLIYSLAGRSAESRQQFFRVKVEAPGQ
jgi:hypothetical protein